MWSAVTDRALDSVGYSNCDTKHTWGLAVGTVQRLMQVVTLCCLLITTQLVSAGTASAGGSNCRVAGGLTPYPTVCLYVGGTGLYVSSAVVDYQPGDQRYGCATARFTVHRPGGGSSSVGGGRRCANGTIVTRTYSTSIINRAHPAGTTICASYDVARFLPESCVTIRA